ncbi:hypothetical protein P7K49_007789 [Saguinus oedipus]|uniref:Uncharacterized protein n=1 Tax=Saguinus oedipus TaxID=9490 RepID=A0ABQ9VVV1_SAGOE|nr:hypothetical protein P7K49_007789 [Saguinus oedipus]
MSDNFSECPGRGACPSSPARAPRRPPAPCPPPAPPASSLPVTAGAAGSWAGADVVDLGESPAWRGYVRASGGVQAEAGGSPGPAPPSRRLWGQRQRQEEEAAGGGRRGGTDRLGGRVVGGEDWGEGGAGGGAGTTSPHLPHLQQAWRAPSKRLALRGLGSEESDPVGEGIPSAPSSDLRFALGAGGNPPSRQPASGLFAAPPSIHPSRCPHHALPRAPRPSLAVSPSPALPVASRAPPAALLRTRVPSCARHLGGLSPSFTGGGFGGRARRFPGTAGAKTKGASTRGANGQRAGRAPAVRTERQGKGGRKGPAVWERAPAPPRDSEVAGGRVKLNL